MALIDSALVTSLVQRHQNTIQGHYNSLKKLHFDYKSTKEIIDFNFHVQLTVNFSLVADISAPVHVMKIEDSISLGRNSFFFFLCMYGM